MGQEQAMRPDESASDGGIAVGRFDVVVLPADRPFSCQHDQPVLHAMIAQGLHGLSVGCRSGGCGVCRVQVVSGQYISLPMSRAKVSPSDEAEGLVLACRIFPRSDLVIGPRPLPMAMSLVK